MHSINQILMEVMWNKVDINRISTSKMKDVKSSKILKTYTKGDYTYYLTDHLSDDIFYGQVFVFQDNIFVGELLIGKWNAESDKYLEASVSVHPDHRRKGIGTEMYNISEKYFKKKFKKSTSPSSDASKFWKSRSK